MSPTLPPSLLQKLSTRCRWRGCTNDKADSDYCQEHHERQKGYQRKSDERRRAKLRAGRKCRDCGTPMPKRWHSSRCRGCQRSQAETAKSRRAKDSARRLQNAPQAAPRTAIRREGDGYERERNVGRAARGAPSREQFNDEVRRDFRELKELLARHEEKFETAVAAGVYDFGRVQRDEALRIVATWGERGIRLWSAITLAQNPNAELDVTAESTFTYRGNGGQRR